MDKLSASKKIGRLEEELDAKLPRQWLWIVGELHDIGIEVAQLEAKARDMELMAIEAMDKYSDAVDKYTSEATQLEDEIRRLNVAFNWSSQKVAQLKAALEELQKGIYDFADIPLEVKNFVYRITTKALKAGGE